MKIFPAIDIKDKKCVRLVKGDFDNKTEYKISPIDQANNNLESLEMPTVGFASWCRHGWPKLQKKS